MILCADMWRVFASLETAMDCLGVKGLKRSDNVFIMYRLDRQAAETERPAWAERIAAEGNLRLRTGRDPLAYHLGSISLKDPAEAPK